LISQNNYFGLFDIASKSQYTYIVDFLLVSKARTNKFPDNVHILYINLRDTYAISGVIKPLKLN